MAIFQRNQTQVILTTTLATESLSKKYAPQSTCSCSTQRLRFLMHREKEAAVARACYGGVTHVAQRICAYMLQKEKLKRTV